VSDGRSISCDFAETKPFCNRVVLREGGARLRLGWQSDRSFRLRECGALVWSGGLGKDWRGEGARERRTSSKCRSPPSPPPPSSPLALSPSTRRVITRTHQPIQNPSPTTPLR
jgi:hypothetical protein